MMHIKLTGLAIAVLAAALALAYWFLPDDGAPVAASAVPAPAQGRSLLSRLRDARPKPLRDDRYADDDDEAPDSDVGPQRPGHE